ncbi:MAG TPA: c-type cytochrome [Caulobacteraceae bacterium]|nr:c-type cytochrome [Caulobacteraceae bacterium]
MNPSARSWGVFAALALAAFALAASSQPESPAPAPPSAAMIAEGRYLIEMGDCAGCHTRGQAPALSGGYPLNTPFGVIYSANITPDKDTGIGSWSEADFYRAMHSGRDDQKHNLYPAFPYTYFTRASRADVDAIRAWLMSRTPVRYTPPANRLPFPLTIRPLVSVWDWLYLKEGEFQPRSSQSAAWNRGAYIVNGLGHCAACHTPKTLLQGDKTNDALQGGTLDNWFAPDLNGDPRGGLATWTAADIAEFLKTGRNAHSSASGSMARVVAFSTSKMSDQDLAAVATYLKALPATRIARARPIDAAVMSQGQAIYVDNCSGCHKMDGTGIPRFFPPLGGNTNVQAANPTTLAHIVLTGTIMPATATRPTQFAMPAFAWKLSDKEIAAVASYIRNSWGNAAPVVSASQVGDLRGKVAAHPVRKPPSKV